MLCDGDDEELNYIGNYLGGKESICVRLQSCLTLCDPMDCSPPGSSLSMGFPRQEYWSRLPFPFPGYLLDPGIELASPAQILYRLNHQGSL